MTPRLLVLSIFPALATATAYAQAPGEWTPEPEYSQPGYSQPGYAQPPPVLAPPAVPSQRWSVGLTFGQTELTAEGYDDQAVTFGTGHLAVRYRGWRHLELELSLGGGSQELDDEQKRRGEGELAMATGTLAARYRFNPGQRWNWWLLAGVGATTVARSDASDQEIEAAQRPHGTLGIGIERRFRRLAFQFELRALAVGQTEEEMQLADEGFMMNQGLSGGTFAFGASYYF